jgi:putative membrane protein
MAGREAAIGHHGAVRNPSDRRSAAELDVDARFLLANERTLLAWVRTSLTFLVAGFGVQQFATDLRARELVALVLLALGAIAAGAGLRRYLLSDAALRRGELPLTGRTPVFVAGSLVLIALAAMVAVAVGAAG